MGVYNLSFRSFCLLVGYHTLWITIFGPYLGLLGMVTYIVAVERVPTQQTNKGRHCINEIRMSPDDLLRHIEKKQ